MERIAILPFENLTGDPAFDWIRDAGPVILGQELAGSAHLLPLHVPDLSEATFAGATRFYHCVFSRNGGATGAALRFSYTIEDPVRHKTVAAGAADGAVLFALNTLARTLDPAAQPFSSSNPEAVAAWGRGEFERAVALDTDFGTAWTNWAEQLARSNKTDEALVVADRALARRTLRSPLDRARMELLAATLRKDENARVAALRALNGLAPSDTATVMGLAEVEQRLRHFTESAALYRRVLATEPGNVQAMNGLGYAEGEAGQLDAAVQTLQQYGRQPNQGANALDSLGEVYFMNGRFAEAEKYFLEVATRDPAFLQGAELMKAAYAHWLAGRAAGRDAAEADTVMRRYLDARAQQNDPQVIWREARWLYSTGRTKEAVAKLATAPASQKAMVERQLSVWRGEVKPPTDLAQIERIYENTNPAEDGLIRTIYAAALVGAGKPDEARALLHRWPLAESAGDPLLESLVFPQFLALRQKLAMQ